jgi:hypothetical protein
MPAQPARPPDLGRADDPPGDFVVMFTSEPVRAPPGLTVADTRSGDQMNGGRAPEARGPH